ncbi:MAG: hypothetical protein N2484_02315 [Clostridia bacterium]|nr:hypothetical protein [Clostridia bacterium]
MFRNNSDFQPRTYSVKSFKRRKGVSLKKVLIYFTFIILSVLILGVTFLSVNKLV